MSAQLQPGIVIINPKGWVKVIGPFESYEASVAWGLTWQAMNDDHPCWQTVRMDFSTPIEVLPASVSTGSDQVKI